MVVPSVMQIAVITANYANGHVLVSSLCKARGSERAGAESAGVAFDQHSCEPCEALLHEVAETPAIKHKESVALAAAPKPAALAAAELLGLAADSRVLLAMVQSCM